MTKRTTSRSMGPSSVDRTSVLHEVLPPKALGHLRHHPDATALARRGGRGLIRIYLEVVKAVSRATLADVVLDPRLRHLDGVVIRVPRSVERHTEQRQHVVHVEPSAFEDAHQRSRTPATAVRFIGSRLDQPPLVLGHVHGPLLAPLPGSGQLYHSPRVLHEASVPDVPTYASDLPAPRRPCAEAMPSTTASVPRF